MQTAGSLVQVAGHLGFWPSHVTEQRSRQEPSASSLCQLTEQGLPGEDRALSRVSRWQWPAGIRNRADGYQKTCGPNWSCTGSTERQETASQRNGLNVHTLSLEGERGTSLAGGVHKV